MAPEGYSRGQIALHWIVALLVLGQFLFHDAISDAFDDGLDGEGFRITAGVALHMAGGGLVLIFAVLRLNLRRERGVPPPPEGDPGWQVALAGVVHAGLYALMFLLPVSGAAAWGQRSETAGDLHETLKSVLLLLVALHVAGAAYGQFVRRKGVLRRMIRPDG